MNLRKIKPNKPKNQDNKNKDVKNQDSQSAFNVDDFLDELTCIFHQVSGVTHHFKGIPEQYIARLFQNGIHDAVYYSSRAEKGKKDIVLEHVSKAIYGDEGVLNKCSDFDKIFFSYAEIMAEDLLNCIQHLKKGPCVDNLDQYYEWFIQSCKPISNALNNAFQNEKKEMIQMHPNFFFKISNAMISGCITELIRRVGHVLAVKQQIGKGILDDKTMDAVKNMLSVFATSGLTIHQDESVNLFYHNTPQDMMKIVLDRAYQLHGQSEKQIKTENALNNLGFTPDIARKIVGVEADHKEKLKVHLPLHSPPHHDKSRDLDLSPKSLAKIGVFHVEKEKEVTQEEEVKNESVSSLDQN